MSLGDATPTDSDVRAAFRRATAAVSGRSAGLVAPLLLFDLLVFVVPFGYLVRISLTEQATAQAFVEGTWSLDGYRFIAESATIRREFVFTLGFAAVVTALAVGIGLVYAYAMWRAEGPLRVALVAGVLVSMFTAIVVKLFAAVLVFSPNGVLNAALVGSGVIAAPLTLVNNVPGAVIAQLYIVVPYAVLATFSVLATVDESLVEAARDLGASRPRAFLAVVLPHTVPGLLVAGVIAFTWSVGSYAAPLLLGSGSERTVGIEVADLLLQEFDWSAAAALAVVVTTTVIAALTLAYLLMRRQGGASAEVAADG
ncbi:ABC transporter permease [Halorubrum yunnanense]|uniref:ABC transporter permease n=1 Tax=Halorubrum yunnanense TaxID=1526162 RepID=A0ABD5YD07_9EURY|nr:ABC transporter permease [Halorubrum yunnanense]